MFDTATISAVVGIYFIALLALGIYIIINAVVV